MAHRRAASRPKTWTWWLFVPVALGLDTAAAFGLTGTSLPMGVILPDGVLVAAPLLAYGAIAFVVLRKWPLGERFAAAAVLLGIHGWLVGLHTVYYVVVWSLPTPAAIRLAHRWSPLIPLLQLVWVPLLALPLTTLIHRRPPPASRRSSPMPSRREVLASRSPHASLRARAEPDREVRVDAGSPELAPAAVAKAVTVLEPAPGPGVAVPSVPAPMVAEVTAIPPLVPPSRSEPLAIAPPPTWFDDLPEPSAHAVVLALPSAEAADEAVAGADQAPTPAAVEPIAASDAPVATPAATERVADGHDVAATPMVVEPVAAVPASIGDAPEVERPHPAEAPVLAVAGPDVPPADGAPPAAAPPLDLHLVARSFAPYGPLLSRDRVVVVDWTPGPDVAIVCAAAREMPRDRVFRLAARLAQVLDTGDVSSALGPIGRLSVQGSDGVIVLTPLDGVVLVAAARRRGALALLEVLSRRVGRPDGGAEPGNGEPGLAVPASAAGPALVDLRPELEGPPPGDEDTAVTCTVRVATPAACVDVVAPQGIEAESVGALVGRLVAALADGEAAGAADLHALGVDLPAHRVVIHPVHPRAHPPRFVAVVGGPERPGLLGRRAERAARTLREAS